MKTWYIHSLTGAFSWPKIIKSSDSVSRMVMSFVTDDFEKIKNHEKLQKSGIVLVYQEKMGG